MATTKKITDLNEASKIGINDLMVLAQSGEKEATSAPVGMLVDKVATQISDGALIEHLAGLSKQKQVLAKALTDKGVAGVTEKSTLDEMAGAVKNLEVLGEKTNLKGTVLYGSSDSGSMFSDTSYSKILPLPLHRLYAYFNTKNKTFSILKFANDFTYETLASVVLNDNVISENGSEFALFSNTDETKVVIRAKSTTGSYSYKCYSFNIVYGNTVTVEQIGQAVEFSIYNYGSATAGAVKHDGTKFFSFQSSYQYARVVDFVSGTSTEIQHNISETNAYNSAKISYHLDGKDFGVAVYGNGAKAAYKVQFDFENNLATYMGTVYLPSAKISNRNQDYWYCPYYIADKNLLVILMGNSKDLSAGDSCQVIYYKSPVEFIAVNTQTGETVSQMVFKNCMHSNLANYICYKQGDSYFYAKLENGRYLIGAAKRGVVEYDPETNKVYAYGTDTELNEGDFIGQVSQNGQNGLYYNQNQTPIVSFDASVLYGATTTTGQDSSISVYSSYYRAVIYPQVVWGELYKRNGKEIVRTSFFEPELYEAGAYAEKDSVEYLNLSEAEG